MPIASTRPNSDSALMEKPNASISPKVPTIDTGAAISGMIEAPGANALELSDAVRATMKDLSKNFPEGIQYEIVYDPTVFVRDSIKAVIERLLEALALVVIVVIVFLQTW